MRESSDLKKTRPRCGSTTPKRRLELAQVEASFDSRGAVSWAAGFRKPQSSSAYESVGADKYAHLVGPAVPQEPYPAGGWDNRTSCPRSFEGFGMWAVVPSRDNPRSAFTVVRHGKEL